MKATVVRMELQGQAERALGAFFAEGKQLASQYGGAVIFTDEMDTLFNGKTTHDPISKHFNEKVNAIMDDPESGVLLVG